MIKLTKKLLKEKRINSYDVMQLTGNKFIIDYMPANNGRFAKYAYWHYKYYVEDNRYYHREFTVRCKADKQPALQQAINHVKTKYGIDMTDKDPFGAYHPSGTLDKLISILSTPQVKD